MQPRIAIPVPTSNDLAYNDRNWPSYAQAVRACGGEPVKVSLNLSPREIAEVADSCQAILLPGSPADVTPAKYGQPADPASAPADLPRENVDELLLQDAHNLYKPILAICFGCQMLNVWRSGTLVQDLAPMPVNHAAGAAVGVAHTIMVAPDSLLASVLKEAGLASDFLPINSSHHQAVGIAGDGLKVTARSPHDGVAEAIEGPQHSSSSHFVLGLQWHPERTFAADAASKAIFERFLSESHNWTPRAILTSVG